MEKTIPIVFLHGFLGSPQDFSSVCSFLPQFPCIKVLLPGHLDRPFSQNFSDWMPEYEKMHLVGYSMGGRLAIQFAHRHPEKIVSLTLLSTHPGLQTKEERQQRWIHDQLWIKKMQNSFADFLIQWNQQPIFGPAYPNLHKQNLHNTEELIKTFSYFSLAHQEKISQGKAFFAVGEFDQKYRTLFPDAFIIKKAFHRVHLENPQAVATLIRERILL